MRRCISVLVALWLLAFGGSALAEPFVAPEPIPQPDPMGAELKRQMGELDLSGWDVALGDASGAFGSGGLKQLVADLASGKTVLSVEGVIGALGGSAHRELASKMLLVVRLVAIALLSAMLSNLQNAFDSKLGGIAGFACYAMAIGVVIAAFAAAAQTAHNAVNSLVGFMQLVFPALLTMLTAIGSPSTAAVFQPATAVLAGSVGTVFMDIVMPLVLAAGALAVVCRLGERATLTKLAKLLKDCCKWLIGILTTVYVGVVSLQGLTAGSFDGVSVRTAKYALNNFVPVAGRMVADTVDTVLGCSLLIKNALGVTSIVLTALILVSPLLSLLGGIFAFRLAAALSEPVAMDKLPGMMSGVADVMVMLFGAVLAVGAMFMITVGLLISAGNAAVMLR